MAMLTMIEGISDSWGKNEYTIGVYLDFRKAFDTVNHSILLETLEHYGVRCIALNWIGTYLTARQQMTRYKNTVSTKQYINHGVP